MLTEYEYYKNELELLKRERNELIYEYICGTVQPRDMIENLNKLDMHIRVCNRRFKNFGGKVDK